MKTGTQGAQVLKAFVYTFFTVLILLSATLSVQAQQSQLEPLAYNRASLGLSYYMPTLSEDKTTNQQPINRFGLVDVDITYTSITNPFSDDLSVNPLNLKGVELDQSSDYRTPYLNTAKKSFFNSKTILATSAIIGGSFALDQTFRNFFGKHHYKSTDFYFDRVDHLGTGKAAMAIIPTTLATGLIFKSERMTQASFNALSAVLVSKPITGLIKYGAGRARPYMNEGTDHFQPFSDYGNTHFSSFSSGHTATAWALFTPYAEEFGRWIYVIPASVGIGRMYHDKHWFSDVIAGAAVGFISGYSMHRFNRAKFIFTGNGLKFRF